MGAELRPVCSPADAQLEVSHNLDLTVAWIWQLKSKQGELLSSGRVIAFQGRDVGAKITASALREIAMNSGPAHNADIGVSSPVPVVAPNTIRAAWMPYDFEQHDTQLTLYVDAERVRGQDSHGRVVFDFPIQGFRDARLTREWDHPMQLGDPTGLVAAAQYAGDHWWDPVLWKGQDTGFNHGALFTVEFATLVAYFGAEGVLTQVRHPVDVLELAWEKEGVVKTIALQLSRKDGRRLIRNLQDAAAAQQPLCEVNGTTDNQPPATEK
jgi:hypothetical protein